MTLEQRFNSLVEQTEKLVGVVIKQEEQIIKMQKEIDALRQTMSLAVDTIVAIRRTIR